jgi:hypothetical protein
MRKCTFALSLLVALVWFGAKTNQPRVAVAEAVAPSEMWEYAELTHEIQHRINGKETETRWITSTSDENIGTDWENVAEILKIPSVKEDTLRNPTGGYDKHKMTVLNHFGIEGWEMCAYDGTVGEHWYFKRRVGK